LFLLLLSCTADDESFACAPAPDCATVGGVVVCAYAALAPNASAMAALIKVFFIAAPYLNKVYG